MKEIIDRAVEIWGDKDMSNWIFTYWLIEEQLKEIKEAGFSGESFIKELSDIAIICLKYLYCLGLDPKQALLHRLNNRHSGRQGEIVEKYREKWVEKCAQ